MENLKTFLSIPFQTTPYAPLPSLRRISYFFPMWESMSFEIGLDICTHRRRRNRPDLKGQCYEIFPSFSFHQTANLLFDYKVNCIAARG